MVCKLDHLRSVQVPNASNASGYNLIEVITGYHCITMIMTMKVPVLAQVSDIFFSPSGSAAWPPRCHRRRPAAPTPGGSNRLRWPPHGQCPLVAGSRSVPRRS